MEKAETIKPINFHWDITGKEGFRSDQTEKCIVSYNSVYKLFIRCQTNPSVRVNKKNLIDVPSRINGHYRAMSFVELFIDLKRGDELEVILPDPKIYDCSFSIQHIDTFAIAKKLT